MVQWLQVAAAAAGDDDPMRARGIGEPPPDHVRGHQGGHLQPHFVHLPGEFFRRHLLEHSRELAFGELTGKKQDMLAHSSGLRRTATRSS